MKLFLLALLALVFPLKAEIQLVTLTWQIQTCPITCVQALEKQFRAIPGVSSVTIFPAGGRAQLLWRADYPFAYKPIDTAMRMIGPSIEIIRVKARGTIRWDGKAYYLVSTGDNTSFMLLGPIIAKYGQYTDPNSVADHPITPQLGVQFNEAIQFGRTVIIDGPLFLPWQSPPNPLRLIVEKINTVVPEMQQMPSPHQINPANPLLPPRNPTQVPNYGYQ